MPGKYIRRTMMSLVIAGLAPAVIGGSFPPLSPDAYAAAGPADAKAPSKSGVRGIEEKDFLSLFLDASELPAGLKIAQDSRLGKPDPGDRKFAELGGRRDGFMIWMAPKKDKPVWRVVDSRTVFPNANAAKAYLTASLGDYSEGFPEMKNKLKFGEDFHLFGPENSTAKALGLKMRGYIFVFRQNNIVIKLFVASGDASKTKLAPEAVVPICDKILQRCGAKGK